MTTAAHTPGPWFVSNGALIRVTTRRDRGALVICGVHRIGKLGGPVEGDPVANAHLIAAAPELLDLAMLHAMRFLTGDQALAAIVLWGSGRFDTLEIAKLLSVGEDAVCRTLRFARDAADQDDRKAVRQ